MRFVGGQATGQCRPSPEWPTSSHLGQQFIEDCFPRRAQSSPRHACRLHGPVFLRPRTRRYAAPFLGRPALVKPSWPLPDACARAGGLLSVLDSALLDAPTEHSQCSPRALNGDLHQRASIASRRLRSQRERAPSLGRAVSSAACRPRRARSSPGTIGRSPRRLRWTQIGKHEDRA